MRDIEATPIWLTRASPATVSARFSHNISTGSHCMPVSSSGCMCRSTRRTSELGHQLDLPADHAMRVVFGRRNGIGGFARIGGRRRAWGSA